MTQQKRNPLAFTSATSGHFTTIAALILVITIVFSRGVLEPVPSRWLYVLVRVALILAWLAYALSLFYGVRILNEIVKRAGGDEEEAGETPVNSDEEDASQITSPPDSPAPGSEADSAVQKSAEERRAVLAELLGRQIRSFFLGTIFLVLFGLLLLFGQMVHVKEAYQPPCVDCEQRCLDCKELQTTVNNVTKNIDFNLKTLVAKFDPNLTLRQEFEFALKNYFEPKFNLHLQKIEQLSQQIEQLNQTCINQQTNINVRVNRGRRRKKRCECPVVPKTTPATNTEG